MLKNSNKKVANFNLCVNFATLFFFYVNKYFRVTLESCAL